MYSISVPSSASHFRSSSATNSGPLSERIFSGIPRYSVTFRQRFDYFEPPQSSRHADRHALSRVFVNQRQHPHPQPSSVVRLPAHKVVAQYMFVPAALSTLPVAKFVVLGLYPHASLDPAAPL
jgi:hypothetical protein